MKSTDADVKAIRAAIRALDKSSSRAMLKANLDFLVDRYLTHPTKSLPDHLKQDSSAKKSS